MLIHEKKNWICDFCGFRCGTKNGLKSHMMLHLPPSFACSKCPKKFVEASNLKKHLKVHAGTLSEVCKICNKGYSTKRSLNMHMKYKHFLTMHCEVDNCSFKTGLTANYKRHLKIHAGILSEVCKICNKGYSTKESLKNHMHQHFSKIHCEVDNCLSMM